LSVNGSMLGGTSVPTSLVRTVLPGPPVPNVTGIKEPLYGADFAFVFIDVDQDQGTGFYVGGSEACIAVAGKGNSIISSKVYTLIPGGWQEVADAEAAVDSYELEVSGSYASLGLVPGLNYAVTFTAEDWSGRQDDISVVLPARTSAGTRAYGGIMINEVFNKGNAANDWIELYNTGSTPIGIGGWQIWVGGVLVYTYPSVTIQPGGFYVAYNLDFFKETSFILTDSSGATVDTLNVPAWQQEKSYGRTGSPPYSTVAQMNPTPGAINDGQTPIPEFGDIMLPLAIVPIILFAISRSKKTRKTP